MENLDLLNQASLLLTVVIWEFYNIIHMLLTSADPRKPELLQLKTNGDFKVELFGVTVTLAASKIRHVIM